jgi:hypothetical protein
VLRFPVQNGNLVPGLQQFLYQEPADEIRPANDEHPQLGRFLPLRAVSRDTQGQGV